MPDPALLRSIVGRAKKYIKLPSGAVSACLKIDERHGSLVEALAKIDLNQIQCEFHKLCAKTVVDVSEGTTHPSAVAGLTIESLRVEARSKIQLLESSRNKLSESSWEHINEIGGAIVAGLLKFEAEIEKQERAVCEEWQVPFEAGPILKTVKHCRRFAEYEFAQGNQYGWGVGASPVDAIARYLDLGK